MYQMLGMMQIPKLYKDNLGAVTGWLPDVTLAEPTQEEAFITNYGLEERRHICGESKEFWLVNKLSLPLFAQNKLLPMNADFQVFVYFNNADFCLLAPDSSKKYMMKVVDAEIRLTKLELQDRWLNQYRNRVARGPLCYNFTDYSLNQFVVPKDTLMKNLAQTSLPAYPKRYIFL